MTIGCLGKGKEGSVRILIQGIILEFICRD